MTDYTKLKVVRDYYLDHIGFPEANLILPGEYNGTGEPCFVVGSKALEAYERGGLEEMCKLNCDFEALQKTMDRFSKIEKTVEESLFI